MFGFMTAVDTYLAQAYGSGQLMNYGLWTGNSLVMVFCATIVASGIMTLCGPFMHLIVSDPELANEAGLFALRLIPGLFPYFLFKVLSKVINCKTFLIDERTFCTYNCSCHFIFDNQSISKRSIFLHHLHGLVWLRM